MSPLWTFRPAGVTVYSYSLMIQCTDIEMNAHLSAEALAVARYMRATRAVSAAFDIVRGEPELDSEGRAVARALERLDEALLELDTSQRSLDAILSRASGH